MAGITIDVQSPSRATVLFTLHATQNVINSFASNAGTIADSLGVRLLSYSGPMPDRESNRDYLARRKHRTLTNIERAREYEFCVGISSRHDAQPAIAKLLEYLQTIARIEGGSAELDVPLKVLDNPLPNCSVKLGRPHE